MEVYQQLHAKRKAGAVQARQASILLLFHRAGCQLEGMVLASTHIAKRKTGTAQAHWDFGSVVQSC